MGENLQEYINMRDGVPGSLDNNLKMLWNARMTVNAKSCNAHRNAVEANNAVRRERNKVPIWAKEEVERLNKICEANGVDPIIVYENERNYGYKKKINQKRWELRQKGIDFSHCGIRCEDCRNYRVLLGNSGRCTLSSRQCKPYQTCMAAEKK